MADIITEEILIETVNPNEEIILVPLNLSVSWNVDDGSEFLLHCKLQMKMKHGNIIQI